MKRILFLLLPVFVFAATVASAQTVYVTKTGAKYHVADCRYLSQSKIAIELKDAIERGYEPCKVCHPPVSSTILLKSKLFISLDRQLRTVPRNM